jgi:outer membrane protein OmpA-like peptidoglycan-associated protein
MKRARVPILIAVSILAVMISVGCNQKDQRMIQELTARNQELQNEKQDLQERLAQAKAREDSLAAELSLKQSETDTLMTRLRELEGKQATSPSVPQPAPGWERGLMGDMVTVGADILFGSGKADLTAAGRSAMDKIANDLKTTYAGMTVRVYGHTDSEPIRKSKKQWQDNLDLSANRAMAVTRYLISKGISAKNIEAVAMGENHPVADNKTAAGKAKNRRVEIVVLRK